MAGAYLFDLGSADDRIRILQRLYLTCSLPLHEVPIIEELRFLFPDLLTTQTYTPPSFAGEKGREMTQVMLTGLGKRLLEEMGIPQLQF